MNKTYDNHVDAHEAIDKFENKLRRFFNEGKDLLCLTKERDELEDRISNYIAENLSGAELSMESINRNEQLLGSLHAMGEQFASYVVASFNKPCANTVKPRKGLVSGLVKRKM